MQQDGKLSRFMFHLKFSSQEEYCHEHELYELTRSRSLFQTQFGVRSNYKKVLRNLQKDEKQRRYNFENSRKMFVQKMKKRRETNDKLRNTTSNKLKSLSVIEDKPKQPQRQYVPVPKSTTVYTDVSEAGMPLCADVHAPRAEDESSGENTGFPLTATSPSMATTAGVMNALEKTNTLDTLINYHIPDQNERTLEAKVIIVGKHKPALLCTKTESKTFSKNKFETDQDTMSMLQKNDELVKELHTLSLNFSRAEGKSKSTEKCGIEKQYGDEHGQTSCVSFADGHLPPLRPNNALTSESKAKVWAEKHGLQTSQISIQKDSDLQRLMIDRPSKWALNLHGDAIHSKIIDFRLHQSKRMFDHSFRRKSRQLDQLSEKLNLKSQLSLPEPNTTPKPMTTLDPGGTTPDGRLILTKQDFDDYLSNYRKARAMRLEMSKKRNQHLSKQISNYRLEPRLCLRDDTGLRTSLKTI